VVATALRLGEKPFQDGVPGKGVNWYRIPPVGADRPLVVTLQPIGGDDSDLYLFPGSGALYGSGATCLGSSSRLPAGGGDRLPSGFAPDWVVLEAKASQGWPTTQVAVWGVPGGFPPKKRYFIECDPVWGLTIDGPMKGGTLAPRDSHWCRFKVKAGHKYWISVTYYSAVVHVMLYVYLERATRFIAGNTPPVVSFTAEQSGTCYLRVYGNTDAPCPYAVGVNDITGLEAAPRPVR